MVTEEAASAHQEAADAFLDNIKKTIEEEICLNRFLMQMKVPYSWKKKHHSEHLLLGRAVSPGFRAGKDSLNAVL